MFDLPKIARLWHYAGIIPYRLSPSLVRKPFLCPYCDCCFAPALHKGPRQDLRMSAETRSVFERASDMVPSVSQGAVSFARLRYLPSRSKADPKP